ncbi:prepilin peptidase [Mariniblastus fucicola]|uniref:Leader peptidase PppA n=1 Tax=Mariniblastus fucicola TaxID=980251 RepID=A0A5B9PMH1_9BACT|nr:prepilin peptidase [Mariniblastus fucicola]QEG23513.1 Leader peptidase PppA [Mariniblastus fucicola]
MLKVVGRILNLAVWLGFAFLVFLLFVVPLAMTLMLNLGYVPGDRVSWWLHQLQHLQIPVLRGFCLIWVFFVGSCFASFLNVVAWRVPRKKSILGSSHCPQCNVQLKFPRNNVPVLGWLKNGGRCANCDLPIPVRYLIAELVLGFTFLILFVVQTTSGGASIPFRTINAQTGIESVLFAPQADLLLTLTFHLTLLSLIFTFAIAATEKFKAPVSLVVFGIIGAAGFQVLPQGPGILDFRLGTWQDGVASNHFLSLLDSPVDFLISIGLGCAASGACFLLVRFSRNEPPFGAFASLLLIGLSLGWQSVLSIAVIFFSLSACTSLLPVSMRRGVGQVGVCGLLFLATLLHLCLWRLQSHCQWWPGPASGVQQLTCGVGYLILLASVQRVLCSSTPESNPETLIDLPMTLDDLE